MSRSGRSRLGPRRRRPDDLADRSRERRHRGALQSPALHRTTSSRGGERSGSATSMRSTGTPEASRGSIRRPLSSPGLPLVLPAPRKAKRPSRPCPGSASLPSAQARSGRSIPMARSPGSTPRRASFRPRFPLKRRASVALRSAREASGSWGMDRTWCGSTRRRTGRESRSRSCHRPCRDRHGRRLGVGEPRLKRASSGGSSPAPSLASTIESRWGEGVVALAFGEGALWAANYADGTIARIDPATNEVTTPKRMPGNLQGIAAGAGSAWVSVVGGTTAGPLSTAACGPPESGGQSPDLLIVSDAPLQGSRRRHAPDRGCDPLRAPAPWVPGR